MILSRKVIKTTITCPLTKCLSPKQQSLRDLAKQSSDILIYILLCEKDKYYIGKTKNIDRLSKRLQEHESGKGAYWTSKHKPILLFDQIEHCDDYDEDKYTLKYMSLFGIDNVRGGSYCQLTLPEGTIEEIKRKISSSDNCCYSCGKPGHFMNECSNK